MYMLICVYSLPYFVIRLFVDFKAVNGEMFNIDPPLMHLATNLNYLVHLANPLIYTMRKADIKSAVKSCFKSSVIDRIRYSCFIGYFASCMVHKPPILSSEHIPMAGVVRLEHSAVSCSDKSNTSNDSDCEARLTPGSLPNNTAESWCDVDSPTNHSF